MSPQDTERPQRAAVTPSPKTTRRRPPNWQEQKKREAWGRFWGQINKGAMKR